MLVRSEEDWRERNGRSVRRMARQLAFLMVMTYLLVIILIGVVMFDDPLLRPLLFALVLIFGILFLGGGLLTAFFLVRSIEGGPVVGLYDRGLQMAPILFIPYEEVASIEQTPRGFGTPSEPMVRLRLRHKPKGLAKLNTPVLFRVSADILGEKGIEELERRVSGILPEEAPPKLVLYGQRSRP
jgi:hypothetical protein